MNTEKTVIGVIPLVDTERERYWMLQAEFKQGGKRWEHLTGYRVVCRGLMNF